jgi:hypothetical protein
MKIISFDKLPAKLASEEFPDRTFTGPVTPISTMIMSLSQANRTELTSGVTINW